MHGGVLASKIMKTKALSTIGILVSGAGVCQSVIDGCFTFNFSCFIGDIFHLF